MNYHFSYILKIGIIFFSVVFFLTLTTSVSKNAIALVPCGGALYGSKAQCERNCSTWCQWSSGYYSCCDGSPPSGGTPGTTSSGGTPGTTRRRTTSPPPPVNGVCGSSTYTCSRGSVSGSGSNIGYYYWICRGSNGGNNVWCETVRPPECNNSIVNACFNGVVEKLPLSHAPSQDTGYNYWHCWNILNRKHVTGCRKKKMPACNNNKINACFNGVVEELPLSHAPSSDDLYNYWHCINSYGDLDPNNDEHVTGCRLPKSATTTTSSSTSSTSTTTTTIVANITISGNVYVDVSSDSEKTGNGVQDTDEIDYAGGATVSLLIDESIVESAVTDSSGRYSFSVPSGPTYTVALVVPDNYTSTTLEEVTIVTSLGEPTTVNFGILPFDRVTGYIFVDDNKNHSRDTGEDCYVGSIPSIRIDNGLVSRDNHLSGSSCTTTTYELLIPSTTINGCHTVSMSAPSGYFVTGWEGSDKDGDKSEANNAARVCGSVVNFGISNSVSWIQVPGGDWRGNGITNTVPPGPGDCQLVSSPDGLGGYPGILFTGRSDADITGSISSTGWLVGGLSYPEEFNPRLRSKTSYSYMRSRMLEGDLKATEIFLASEITESGIYYRVDEKDLSIDSNLNIDGNKDIVVLVNGNLNVNAEIHVEKGSTLTFSVAGDIIVNATVGQADFSSTSPNLEGYFSTDNNFIVEGASNCGAAAPDKRLNIEGSVVAGAGGTGGRFINDRDLCLENLSCPAFYVAERPDFVLNAPAFLRYVNYKWREVAP